MLLCPAFLSRHTLKLPCMLHWHIEETFSVCTSATIRPYPHPASRHLAPCLPPYRNLAHPGSSCSGASNAPAPETRPRPCSRTRRQWPLCVRVPTSARVCVTFPLAQDSLFIKPTNTDSRVTLSNSHMHINWLICCFWLIIRSSLCWLMFCLLFKFPKWSWGRGRFPLALWY